MVAREGGRKAEYECIEKERWACDIYSVLAAVVWEDKEEQQGHYRMDE